MFAKVVKKSNYMFKREKKEKKFLGKLTTFFVFKHNNFSLIWQKMINNVDKTAFDVSKELNWGNKIVGIVFLRIMSYFSLEVLQKLWNFRRSYQNWNNHIQVNILSVSFWNFFKVLFVFELWVESFWISA